VVQQALIVDDSKTARVVLGKMLTKHQFGVTMLESAEEALSYLQDHHPSVIFMDHMMPGMDGFDAVKVIKANPAKSSIPIVMHTTKQGDIYIGQAKALGAADILVKPASDSALSALFERLGVGGETESVFREQDMDTAAVELVSEVKGTAVNHQTTTSAGAIRATSETSPENTDLPDYTTEVVNNQSASLHKSSPDPIITDPLLASSAQASSNSAAFRLKLLLVLSLAMGLWVTWLYFLAQEQLETNKVERLALYKSIAWAINQQESYDYGELAMSGRRLELLQGLLPVLADAGFKGEVRIEGHIGAFCLANVVLDDGSMITVPAAADLPLSQCAQIGSSAREAMELSGRQSNYFTDYIQLARSAYPDINVEVVARGESFPAIAYPVNLEQISAGDWNSVALLNNRVQFELIASE
jgi:CheY-like chemotaxis protein